MVVSKDPSDGRVMVLKESLGAPLVRIGGSWFKDVFSPDDLKDNFFRVNDSIEAETLFQEASAALSSNPNLPSAPDQAWP
jgi:hypothetical protein